MRVEYGSTKPISDTQRVQPLEEKPGVMRQYPPFMAKRPPADFWDRYEEVPLAEYTSSRRVAMARGNQTLRDVWEQVQQGGNPAAWYHVSWRVRCLRMALRTYAPEVGISVEVVPRLEDPERDFQDMRYHPSLSRVVQYWGDHAEEHPKGVKDLLLEGRQKYLDAVVASEPSAVNRFIFQRRILEGSSAFEDKIQHTTIFQRLKHGRITSLREMIEHVLELCPPEAGGDIIEVQGEVRAALEAFLHDLQKQGTPEAVALLRAAVELTGRDFSREGLHDLGVSYAAAETILDHEPVAPHFRDALLSALEPQVDPAVHQDLVSALEQWEQDPDRGPPLHAPFRRLLREQGMHSKTANSLLLQAFGVQSREGDKVHDIVRRGIERGPSPALTPAGLAHLLSPTPEECETHLDHARRVLRAREEKNCTKASVPIRAELLLWGVRPDDLGYGKRDLHAFRELKRGAESSLAEEQVLSRIQEVGLHDKVQPALERWVTLLEPSSVEKALELLMDRTKGGASAIAHDAHSSVETIMKVIRGEIAPDFALLQDLFEAAGVEIPPSVAVDCHLKYARFLRDRGMHHFGAALHSVASRTHRRLKAFHRDRCMHTPCRSFFGHVQRACENGMMAREHLDEFLQAAGIGQRSPCASSLRLREGCDNALEALYRWQAQMQDEGQDKVLAGLPHLREIVERLEEGDKPHDPPRSIEALQQRKEQLHRWRFGLPSSQGKGRERLSTVEDDAALYTLLQLQGITKDEVLFLTEPLTGTKSRKKK